MSRAPHPKSLEAQLARFASRFPSPKDQQRLRRLAVEGWLPASTEPEGPLQRLQGRPLGGATLEVLLGPTTRYGAQAFQLYLRSPAGLLSDGPLLSALHHSGPHPSQNWVEVTSTRPRLTFPSGEAGEGFDLNEDDKELPLLSYLAGLIPPGGHLMVEYESPPRRETARSLALGIPPLATPLGYLLFRVGCGVNIRNWYIPEGGAEGPRKLQGYKALNDEHARRRAEQMARELSTFLRESAARQGPLWEGAQRRARWVLAALGHDAEGGH